MAIKRLILTKKEMAAALNRTEQAITVWQNQGMPYTRAAPGKANKYDFGKVLQWCLDNGKVKPGVTADYDLDKERARLAAAQANKAELELAKLQGELIPTDIVSRAWQKLCLEMRAKVLAIPVKAAPKVVLMKDPKEAHGYLKAHCHDSLESISEIDVEKLFAEYLEE